MTNLSVNQKSLPLNKIVIPGTHNSGAYTLDLKHCITDATSSFSQYLTVAQKLRFLPGLKWTIGRFTLCQEKSIYDQLMMGVRFLDIRLSYQDGFYITHTFTCIPLQTALADILKFVQNNPNEIIILSVQPDYENESTMVSAYSIITNALLPHLVPGQTVFPSINSLNESGKSILLFYENEIGEASWDFPLINSVWSNTDKISVLQTGIATFPFDSSKLNVCQAILTPTEKDVLTCNTLSRFARLVWLKLFRNSNNANYNKFSVILLDLITPEKIKYIIASNK